MTLTRKIWNSKKGVNTLDYIGEEGEIFYRSGVVELRFSDGVTPGGILFGAGGMFGGGTAPGVSFFSSIADRDASSPSLGQLAFVADTGTGVNGLYMAVQITPTNIWANIGISNEITTSNSLRGAGTVENVTSISYDFDYSLNGNILIGTLTPGQSISNIDFTISQQWNDFSSAASLGISTNSSFFMDNSNIDLTSVGAYVNPQQFPIKSTTGVILTVHSGASTQGRGNVTITYEAR